MSVPASVAWPAGAAMRSGGDAASGAPAAVSAAAGSVSSTVSGVEMAYAESATFVGSSSRRSLSCTSSTLKLPTPRARALWFSAGRRARETSAFQPSGSA